MAQTYEPIATATLGAAATSITFSSIPDTYTDLRIVFVATPELALRPRMDFNSDTGANYCGILISGDGSTVSTNLYTANTYVQFTNSNPSTYIFLVEADILGYTNNSYKTVLSKYSYDVGGGGGRVTHATNTWNSLSVISTVRIFSSGNNFNAGATATLYGIKKG